MIFLSLLAAAGVTTFSYPIVGTGQTKCFDNWREITPPRKGAQFYGQDAQFVHRVPSYQLSADGVTVVDNVTGLVWQRSPDKDGNGVLNAADKFTFQEAQALPAKLNAAHFGGFSDWRLPTIKELYSLILFSGADVSGPNLSTPSRQNPFMDTRYFKFAYGDTRAGERPIDSQWATSTAYVANPNQMFGVNFADGRIKGYGTRMPGGRNKTFFVLCVRGNPAYGHNDFHDNSNGTITDRSTGLMWTKSDSAKGMDWQSALAWVQQKNAERFLGYNDWRLPNAKELQSIVDYSRSPATSQSAAIDPVFSCTQIKNEQGQPDFPYFWTATTHEGMRGGDAAVYVSFGRAAGWMSPPGQMGGPQNGPKDGPPNGPMGGPQNGPRGGRSGRNGMKWEHPPRQGPEGPMEGPPDRNGPPDGGDESSSDYHFEDVHGAGAQRSDPKSGDPAMFPHGRGPQGDTIHIYNFVRMVRG